MSCTGSLTTSLHLSKRTASVYPWSEKGALSQKSLTCAKRTSMNKATYLSLKSDFVKGVWTGIQSFACLGFLERERSKFQRVLRDFAVWRSIETRAWSRSRFESLRWVCEWLWDPRGEGDILTTCIFAIFHLVLLFVVKKASWYGKVNPLLDLPCKYLM